MRRTCPRCKLINPETATRCECGYQLGQVNFTEAVVKSIDLSWGETFFLCLKVGLCAIPAIWIAWFAWNVPGMVLQTTAALATYTAATKRPIPPAPPSLPPLE